VLVALITKYGKWGYLWRVAHLGGPQEDRRDVHHRRHGHAAARLRRRRMMRGQLAMATGGNLGYLPPEHYDQIFTAHGVIMIIFMAMPFMTGLMNIVVPLQIGARDVAFPS
jgi:cytochrome o ubiquinol oxidase subunit 1